MSARWPAWSAISLEDLVRLGLLLPRPGDRVPRRILRVPHPDRAPPPPRTMCWSGEAGRELTVPVFSAAGLLLGYCTRGDGWTSDPNTAFG